MLNTADILVCSFLFAVQGRLDGYPIPRPWPNLDGVRPSVQPSDTSSSVWMFPATRLYSSYRRNCMSSTSLLLFPTTSHNRISSSPDNDYGRNGISSSDGQAVIPQSLQRLHYSFDNKGVCKVSYSSQPSMADNDMRSSKGKHLKISSPASCNKLRISSTSSYAMRLSNFRLSKNKEAPPMILFDEKGEMHTNYYPPVGHRSNKNR